MSSSPILDWELDSLPLVVAPQVPLVRLFVFVAFFVFVCCESELQINSGFAVSFACWFVVAVLPWLL